MGCCSSTDKRNAEIEAQLKREAANMDHEVKLLLLGAGESGKSTIVKQMKIIHNKGYDDNSRRAHKKFVLRNIVQGMSQLLDGADRLSLELANRESQDLASYWFATPDSNDDPITDEKLAAIQTLWEDETLKRVWDARSEAQVNDSARYFLDRIGTVRQSNYVPSEQDILRTRVRTTGIVEMKFRFGGLNFTLVDVGGQRNERKKWIHCFEGVTAVIFCVALSEYDQKLFEDENVNRMQESLQLFDEICNSRWFRDTSMILFLNKTDLFRDKIERGIPITHTFPGYSGGQNFEETSSYITQQFKRLNHHPTVKDVYPHFTCATDTDNIRLIFTAVKDIILQTNLRQSGFL